MKQLLFIIAIAMTLAVGCTSALDEPLSKEVESLDSLQQIETDSIINNDENTEDSIQREPKEEVRIFGDYRVTDEFPPSDILFINFEDSVNKLHAPIQEKEDITLTIGPEGIDTIIEFKYPAGLIHVISNWGYQSLPNIHVFHNETTIGSYDGPANRGPAIEYIFPTSWHIVDDYFGEHYAKKYWVFGPAETDDKCLSTSCVDPYHLHIKVKENTDDIARRHLAVVGIDYPRRCIHFSGTKGYEETKNAYCDYLHMYNSGGLHPYHSQNKGYLYTQADGLARFNRIWIKQAAK